MQIQAHQDCHQCDFTGEYQFLTLRHTTILLRTHLSLPSPLYELFHHGLWVSTLAFELIQQVYDRPPFFARSRSLELSATPLKSRFHEASFWWCDKLIQWSWASEKRWPIINLLDQLKRYFCVGFFWVDTHIVLCLRRYYILPMSQQLTP